MDNTLKLTILILGIAFDVAVFFLLVTRRINERASLPWILGSVIIMVFSLMPNVLEVLAHALGVSYPPALLFLIAILIILLLLLYQSIHISILQNKSRELAQNLAIINSIVNKEPPPVRQEEPIQKDQTSLFSVSPSLPIFSQYKNTI